MKKPVILFCLVIACSFLLSACNGITGSCSQEEIKTNVDQLDQLFTRFNDKIELASSTSKIELIPIVSELQEIHLEAKDLEIPTCIQEVKDTLTIYMETMIDGLILFTSDEPEIEVSEKVELATKYMGNYIIASLEARVGTPTPEP